MKVILTNDDGIDAPGILALEKALELQETWYPSVHRMLGRVYEEMGRIEEAGRQYRLSRMSQWDTSGYVKSARNYIEDGNLEPAAEALRKAIVIHSETVGLHGMLGEVLAQLGRRDEAIKHLRMEMDISTRGPSAQKAMVLLRELGAQPRGSVAPAGASAVFDGPRVDGYVLLVYSEDFDRRDILDALQNWVQSELGLRVRVEAGPPLPARAYDDTRGQYNCWEKEAFQEYAAAVLQKHPGAVALVVLCSKDMSSLSMSSSGAGCEAGSPAGAAKASMHDTTTDVTKTASAFMGLPFIPRRSILTRLARSRRLHRRLGY